MDLVCANIRKVYPDGKAALQGIDLTVGKGLFGLLGPNGAGKTTLMEILTLLMEPTSGNLIVGGINSRKHPMKIRAMLGYLPQFFGFFPELTAKEFLEYMGAMRGLRGRVKNLFGWNDSPGGDCAGVVGRLPVVDRG